MAEGRRDEAAKPGNSGMRVRMGRCMLGENLTIPEGFETNEEAFLVPPSQTALFLILNWRGSHRRVQVTSNERAE